MMELDLEKFLTAYRNLKVDFYRFPGNYGDSLIWHGTQNLLATSKISTTDVDIHSQKYSNILMIDGGGNFVDFYSDVSDFLRVKSNLYDRIIILPHTIFGNRQLEILNNITSDLTVFCREKISANFVRENLGHGEVYLWHDCAFYNKITSIPSGKGVFNAFRTDKESMFQSSKIPELNNDISSRGYAKKPLEELINVLSIYEEIKTDRLHLAICGALLGKKVKLYPNSYYKNKAVYDYSLKERYPNVQFLEDCS